MYLVFFSFFGAVEMSEFDVIVVGKGNAAMCAALSAHDQGAKVAILEAASEDEGAQIYFELKRQWKSEDPLLWLEQRQSIYFKETSK